MNKRDPTPPGPEPSQRLLARARPGGKPVMYQNWRDLLFLHWEYPTAAIQATLPDGFVNGLPLVAALLIMPDGAGVGWVGRGEMGGLSQGVAG